MLGESEKPPRRAVVGDLQAMMTATNIDRRTCQRVVPMQVMCMGVSRTGTSSIRQALLDLGYSDVYHYGSVINENPRDGEMWVAALEAKFEGKGKPFTWKDWDQLLGHCMALTDTPCMAFYKDLLAAYPDTKIILTVRDNPQQWFDSQMRTIMPFLDRMCLPPATWSAWVYRYFLPPPTAFDRMNVLLTQHYEMYRLLAEDLRHGTKKGIKWYEDYCAEIQAIVPKDRLLVMNVKEGWEPLCAFLGKERPGWEFPNVNSTAEWYENVPVMYKMIDQIVYWNMAKTLAPVAVVVLGFGMYWFVQTR